MHELDQSLRAGYPLIYFVTHEELRAIEIIRSIATRKSKNRKGGTAYDIFVWSFTKGFRVWNEVGDESGLLSAAEAKTLQVPYPLESDCKSLPGKALDTIGAYDGQKNGRKAVFVLLDFHPFLESFEVRRQLRDTIEATLSGNGAQSTIIVAPVLQLPEDLAKSTAVIDLPLPDQAVLNELVSAMVASVNALAASDPKAGPRVVTCSQEIREEICEAAAGLTLEEAAAAMRKGLVGSRNQFNEVVAAIVREEKKQLIRKDGVLDFIPAHDDLSNVGGLSLLKPWISDRRDAFGEAARAYGLPAPKGLLLVGVQGCGKSLIAKAVASEWHLPLLRLDMGRIFSPMVGSSEAAARRVIKVAEACAPTVLWVDEIDKGFAGASSSDQTDGGVTGRVISTFLTWMQEKTSPVFIVATANNVVDENGREKLPPELMRKGRFDEIFFVDLPRDSEREEIWRIQMRKYKRDIAALGFDLDDLVESTRSYSGAEIEQVVIDALYLAFADKAGGKPRELRQTDLETVIKSTHPLAEFAKERIDGLRAFAQHRMRPANGEEKKETVGEARERVRRSSMVGTRVGPVVAVGDD